MTFWVFGDSFMAFDNNYISTIRRACNANRVKVLGVNGTGLLYTYQRLLEYKDKIKEDDVVLIGLSSPHRHMFVGDRNLSMHTLQFGTEGVRGILSEEHYEAAQMYFKYLCNDKHVGNLAHAIVSSIFHSIIPSLKTHRVSAIITTNTDGYTNRYNLPDALFNDLSMFEIAKTYLMSKRNYTMEGIMKELDGKNHWLVYRDYSKYFFNKIKRVLDELGIDGV